MNNTITIRDFIPINTWTLDNEGPIWVPDFPPIDESDLDNQGSIYHYNDFNPKYIIDESTGRRYWNESKGIVRFKCALLTVGTPLIHPLTSVVTGVGLSALRVLSLSHFWAPYDINASFSEKLVNMSTDLLKIVIWPLFLLALELSAIYGLISPYNGRKLYASLERAYYDGAVLAPCFQPDPTRHAFGGDPTKRNAF